MSVASRTRGCNPAAVPVSPSATRGLKSIAFAYDENGEPGLVPTSEPRALETAEVPRITQDFVRAALNQREDR